MIISGLLRGKLKEFLSKNFSVTGEMVPDRFREIKKLLFPKKREVKCLSFLGTLGINVIFIFVAPL